MPNQEKNLIYSNENLFMAIEELHVQFANTAKPLIVTVESLYEKFPLEIINEIRAFNDHIVRCYANCKNEEEVLSQIQKAKSHVSRIILDCYKCLNIKYHDMIEEFQRKTKYIDLTTIDNGLFSGKYNELYRKAIHDTRKAKLEETRTPELRYELYEKSYLSYLTLYNYIVDNTVNVNWARAKCYFKRTLSVAGWVATTVLSYILADSNGLVTKVVGWIFP